MGWIKKVGVAASAPALAITIGLVNYFEGSHPTAYFDPVGIPTICEGHTETVTAQDVRDGLTLTDEQCEDLLRQDLQVAVDAVERAAPYPLPDNVKGAFISFVFNVGEGNWQSSTLLRKLKEGKPAEACRQLLRWVYADGKYLQGLRNRREAEKEYCEYYLETAQ